jgi:hypothetical protein
VGDSPSEPNATMPVHPESISHFARFAMDDRSRLKSGFIAVVIAGMTPFQIMVSPLA